jgi:5-deoxy-glucuronate isomerase
MAEKTLLFPSARLPQGTTGTELAVTPAKAGWKLIHFSVRRLAAGDGWDDATGRLETALVLLRGTCGVEWKGGHAILGPRASVFGSYPHAMYLPPGTQFRVSAQEDCQLAYAGARSRRTFPARIIRPEDCGYEIRGGGNATRQIVDIMPPEFAADRLLICEVYTPSGNWSSYPPHKHDVDNPPSEVKLEEIYYYQFQQPEAYGFQRLYSGAHRIDRTVTVSDGDVVVVRNGYHPFVTAYGYHAYYLNVLAGDRRSMAASDDPRYAAFRQSWPEPDPRLPIVAPPAGRAAGTRATAAPRVHRPVKRGGRFARNAATPSLKSSLR